MQLTIMSLVDILDNKKFFVVSFAEKMSSVNSASAVACNSDFGNVEEILWTFSSSWIRI